MRLAIALALFGVLCSAAQWVTEMPINKPEGVWTHTSKPVAGTLMCFRNSTFQIPTIDYTAYGSRLISPYWSPKDTVACVYQR